MPKMVKKFLTPCDVTRKKKTMPHKTVTSELKQINTSTTPGASLESCDLGVRDQVTDLVSSYGMRTEQWWVM